MSEVIDTTQMYLRTVYELLEESVAPLRARIAERMGHSTPTVSQTVSRMARDGLLAIDSDRRITLTEHGGQLAMQVMRRHRLAERLLVDVIGLPWPAAHEEACKWEHVISETVESRIVDLVADPLVSVYGTPIPRLSDSVTVSIARFRDGVRPVAELGSTGPVKVRLVRIGEFLQHDVPALEGLAAAGVVPGVDVQVVCDATGVTLTRGDSRCRLGAEWSEQLFIA